MHNTPAFLTIKAKTTFSAFVRIHTELTRFNNRSGDYCCILNITTVFFCDLMVSFLCITQSKETLILVPSNYFQCFCIFILLFLFCGYTGHISHAGTLIFLSHFITILSVYSHVITTAPFYSHKASQADKRLQSNNAAYLYLCLF